MIFLIMIKVMFAIVQKYFLGICHRNLSIGNEYRGVPNKTQALLWCPGSQAEELPE